MNDVDWMSSIFNPVISQSLHTKLGFVAFSWAVAFIYIWHPSEPIGLPGTHKCNMIKNIHNRWVYWIHTTRCVRKVQGISNPKLPRSSSLLSLMLSWGDLPQLRSHGPHDVIHFFKTDPIEDLLYLEKQGGGVRLSVGEWGDNCSTVMFLSNQELSDARDIVSSHEAQIPGFFWHTLSNKSNCDTSSRALWGSKCLLRWNNRRSTSTRKCVRWQFFHTKHTSFSAQHERGEKKKKLTASHNEMYCRHARRHCCHYGPACFFFLAPA